MTPNLAANNPVTNDPPNPLTNNPPNQTANDQTPPPLLLRALPHSPTHRITERF